MRDITAEKRQLADALRTGTIAERDRLAAFILNEVTAFAANPFASATAGVARSRCDLREKKFEAMQVVSAGPPCLLAELTCPPLSNRLALAGPLITMCQLTD